MIITRVARYCCRQCWIRIVNGLDYLHELPPLVKAEGYSGWCWLYLVCTRWTEEFPKFDTEYSRGDRHVSPASDVTTEVHIFIVAILCFHQVVNLGH